MLPLLETYINNPTRYCWDRLVDFYGFNYGSINKLELQQEEIGWSKMLSPTVSLSFEKDQGMILLKMVMLRESIMNTLKPERNR